MSTNPGRGFNREGNRSGRSRRWTRGGRSFKKGFQGNTKEMNGKVFQLQTEQKRRGQFRDTLEQLHVYASTTYKKDIRHMRVLFTSLDQPVVTKPELVEGATKGQEVEHIENYKQYIKEQKSLESSLASLYNVTWGQCSKLL